MSNVRLYLVGLLVSALACLVPTAAWAINTRDILVADRGEGLVYVDRVTGAQHLLPATPPSSGGYIDVVTNSAGDVFALGTCTSLKSKRPAA